MHPLFNPKPKVRRVYVGFDLETTGCSVFNGDEMTEIGAYAHCTHIPEDRRQFGMLVTGSKPIPPDIVEKTHITNALRNTQGISPQSAMVQFMTWMSRIRAESKADEVVLIGHNLFCFDLPMVYKLLWEMGMGDVRWFDHVVDTLRIVRGSKAYTGCRRLGDLYLAATGQTIQNAHRASADAKANVRLYLSKWFKTRFDADQLTPRVEWLKAFWKQKQRNTEQRPQHFRPLDQDPTILVCASCQRTVSPHFKRQHVCTSI